MCLYTSNKKRFVAKRDYIVYKYLTKEGTTYFTPYQQTKIERLNNTLKAEITTYYSYNESYKFSMADGFIHAVLCKNEDLDYGNCIAFKAIIKKGTAFYIGDGLCDICARELFITDEVVKEFPSLYDVMKPIIEDFIDDIFETEETSCGSYRMANGTYVSPKAIFKQTFNLNDEIIGVVNCITDNTTNVVGLEERKLSWCNIEYDKIDDVTKNKKTSVYSAEMDYNGKKHTKDVVSHKNYSEENYPAFAWCDNYVTKGTNKGDWYIGGCGEVKELICHHMFKVNVALLILQSIQNNVNLIKDGFMWSSSERGKDTAWILDQCTGVTYGQTYKKFSGQVRPFTTF